MQSQLNFQSREIDKPSDFISMQKAQLILTILSLAVTFFAILELSLS